MNDHDLHDQLERLGRRPVPPPRPEFVETLLARIQLADDLSVPSNVVPMRRQRWAQARVAVVGVAAAVLLGAVGMVTLTQGASEPGTKVGVEMVMQSSSGEETTVDASSGELLGDRDQPLADGDYRAKCREGGVINYETGSLECETDETVYVTVEGGRIVDARRAAGVAGGAAPETSTTVGSVTALDLEYDPIAGGVEMRWLAPQTSTPVHRYQVLRSADAAGGVTTLDPETTTPYLELPADASAWSDVFSSIAEGTPEVSYRIVAVDAAGRPVADSGTLSLELRWETTSSTR